MLINDDDEIYAFDRDNNVFRIPSISFPHRKETRHIRDTLVDTEVIIDKVPFNYIFDDCVDLLANTDLYVAFIGFCVQVKSYILCIRSSRICGFRRKLSGREVVYVAERRLSIVQKEFSSGCGKTPYI